MASPRYAVYYTPPPDSPLAQFGASVLGYDCFTAADVAHRRVAGLEPSDLASATVEPRRYGFHATLVAPFHLNGRPEEDLLNAFDAFARTRPPVMVGCLGLDLIGGYVVLVPLEPDPRIGVMAGASVHAFDGFRAPMSSNDQERRLAAELTERQIELLQRWGYPHVFDQFRFHMTLAGPLPEGERATVKARLATSFEDLAGDHVEIDAISLMRQDDRDARFHVLTRRRLTGR